MPPVLAAAAAVWTAGSLRPFEILELRTLDAFLKWRGTEAPSKSLLIVGIDDKSLEEIQEPYAFYARHIARAIQTALDGGAWAVGLDAIQPREYVNPEFKRGSREMAALLRKRRDVVCAYRLYPDIQASTFLRSLENAGAVNLTRDLDGVVRRQRLVFEHPPGVPRPGLAFKIHQAAASRGFLKALRANPQPETVIINYAGPGGTVPRLSLVDVYKGRTPAGAFKDKIVLIGDVSAEGQEVHMTPFSADMPGVEVHANVLHTLLSGRRLAGAPGWINVLIVLILAAMAAFIFSVSGAGMGGVAAFVLSGAYAVGAYTCFIRGGIKLEVVRPLMAVPAVYAAVYGRRFARERKKRALVQGLFSQYVAPEVVREILTRKDGLKLSGETREVTVLFSDIENFSTLSEKLPPDQLVMLLNTYFSAMVGILFKEKGTLGKFLGDGLMAYWGAPVEQKDHAERAARAAAAMCAQVADFADQWQSILPFRFNVRIGIHTGEVIAGDIGSVAHREYTVIGDNVNIAARLEPLNKQFGSRMMISAATYEHVKHKSECRRLGSMQVKGKDIPVEVYELSSWKG
ncbi:MAG: adenylate/guanylate cyclase domain-containing protein [Elusimicrobia bacterium]|nr:adenylate/guanylate cyclase domain-containing protein [Elusimicrobiota bacterium]